jgi:hypothetical protein
MSHLPDRIVRHGDITTIQTGGGWLATREERRAAREITRTRLRSVVVAAHEDARVDVVRHVSQSALIAASDISALEAALASQTPYAAVRLQHIADLGATTLAGIVTRSGGGI